MSRSITDHRSRSRVRASFLYMHCEPQELFFLLLLLCQPFYISRVSLFLFFSLLIVALHKHWRMLNHLTVRSACFGDAPLAARFRSRRSCTCWLWTFPSELSCGFSCCFFSFSFFLSFSLLLSLSFLFSVVTSNFFLFFFEWSRSPPWLRRHLLDNRYRRCLQGLGHWLRKKAAGIFGAHSVQGHRRWGRPRQGLLGALEKKNLSLRNVSKPKVSYTGQLANLHGANARIQRNVSWWTLGARPLLSKFLPFATVLRNPWQGLSLTRSGPVSGHLSIPPRRSWKCIRRPSTLPVSQGNGGSLFPSVRATRSDTVSVRLGNV